MPNLIKRKKSKKKAVKPLPKKIRNELMSCCAMKACDTLALGKSKRVKDQHKDMAIFFMDIHQTILVKSSYYVLLHVHIRVYLIRLLPSLKK